LKRRNFIYLSGMGAAGAVVLPKFQAYGKSITQEQALEYVDVRIKKELADVALNTAKSKGATYADIRIGRYLNQAIITREKRVQNVGNSESYGIGIRVIANGSWGFAASNDVTKEGVAKTAERAVAVAKANSKILKEPVQLAPQKGYGEVSWKTPIEKMLSKFLLKKK
jgi:TldD protein